MTMQEAIEQSKKELELRSDTYFKTIVDFLKWTSTVTIGVMLWIGDNLGGITDCSLVLAMLALVCLFTSLVIAIIVVRQVIIAAAKEWSLAIADSAILQNSILKNVLLSIVPADELRERFEQKERETKDHKWGIMKAAQPFSQPKRFDALITAYVTILLAGLSLYVFAQVLNALLS